MIQSNRKAYVKTKFLIHVLLLPKMANLLIIKIIHIVIIFQ